MKVLMKKLQKQNKETKKPKTSKKEQKISKKNSKSSKIELETSKKELDISPKKLSNINFWTLIFSLLVLVYIVAIWCPYTFSVAPENEANLERASAWAHILCVLIFLPTVLYVRFIIKHFKEINKFRFILYPLMFITCFIILHAGLFSISPVCLWYWIITVPAWIIWFIAIIIEAIIKDLIDLIGRKKENNENDTIEKDTKS